MHWSLSMQNVDSIDFWFSVGSTYTYLTVARLDQIALSEGVTFRWRPFDVSIIMKEQKNFPFSNKPIKAAYMWRDIERRAGKYGIPVRVPAPYPPPELELANRIAVLADKEGWCPAYVKAAYARWFVHGEVVGGGPNVLHTLREAGQDVARVLDLARSNEIGDALMRSTNEARRLNIFGSPTFITRGELFWGDDRLEDAVLWQRRGDCG